MQRIITDPVSFEQLRTTNGLYVDKTGFLTRMLRINNRFHFMSRPNQFGKTLTISMLEALFQGRKELFEGLEIYDQYDWTQAYPVLRFDFGDCQEMSTYQEFDTYLSNKLLGYVKKYNVDLDIEYSLPSLMFRFLIEDLSKSRYDVVVLIDNFDRPIINNIKSPDLENIVSTLRVFYGAPKSVSSKVRFMYVTGKREIRFAGLFEVLYFIQNASLDTDYGTMYGYSRKELEGCLAGYLDNVGATLGMTQKQLFLKIDEVFDSFQFCDRDEKCEPVYNPSDINRFLVDEKHDFTKIPKRKKADTGFHRRFDWNFYLSPDDID